MGSRIPVRRFLFHAKYIARTYASEMVLLSALPLPARRRDNRHANDRDLDSRVTNIIIFL